MDYEKIFEGIRLCRNLQNLIRVPWKKAVHFDEFDVNNGRNDKDVELFVYDNHIRAEFY